MHYFLFIAYVCVVRSVLCMLAAHKLTLGTPLHVSHSSQDATPVVSGKVTPIGGGSNFFGPFFGSMSLTAGAV